MRYPISNTLLAFSVALVLPLFAQAQGGGRGAPPPANPKAGGACRSDRLQGVAGYRGLALPHGYACAG